MLYLRKLSYENSKYSDSILGKNNSKGFPQALTSIISLLFQESDKQKKFYHTSSTNHYHKPQVQLNINSLQENEIPLIQA